MFCIYGIVLEVTHKNRQIKSKKGTANALKLKLTKYYVTYVIY